MNDSPFHHRAIHHARQGSKRVLTGYRRQTVHAKALIWTVILALGLIIVPRVISQQINRVHEATLYFVPPPVTPSIGEIFPVEIRVRTSGQAINSVGTVMKFNPVYLEIANMTTDKSFCSFYLDNAFDNIRGEVRVTCGAPSPGFTGDSVVVHLNMRAKIPGTTSLTLNEEDSRALANDGKGTDLLNHDDLPKLPLTLIQLL